NSRRASPSGDVVPSSQRATVLGLMLIIRASADMLGIRRAARASLRRPGTKPGVPTRMVSIPWELNFESACLAGHEIAAPTRCFPLQTQQLLLRQVGTALASPSDAPVTHRYRSPHRHHGPDLRV